MKELNNLNENEFNKLMRNALKKIEMHPEVSIEAIAILSCLPYQGREDYGDIRKQVVYNLEKAMVEDNNQ